MRLDCREMRIDLMKMALAAKGAGAHLGGSLSAVEIMAALYGGAMNYRLDDEDRDRLIFSKGHGVMAQYVALKQVGLLTEEELLTYKQTGSVVSAHPSVHQRRLGIDFASGSLGQGLSLGVGSSLALRRRNSHAKVYVLVGDGECDEGAIWEAAMAASNYSLDRLVVIVDQNGLQYDGDTEKVLKLGNLAEKWRAFGWETEEVDGHNVHALHDALVRDGDCPRAVIARTIKGKGISFMENVPAWHHGVLTQKLFDQAMAELAEGGVA